jgi:hypothetical protein
VASTVSYRRAVWNAWTKRTHSQFLSLPTERPICMVQVFRLRVLTFRGLDPLSHFVCLLTLS